nr:MAG TPA: hypothetical protein [Caudoviricetes sp.]DAR31330.1 MAG TPA: hypothetical protein [Caudoviricetes sp.]
MRSAVIVAQNNQFTIFAVSLHFSPMSATQEKSSGAPFT